MNRKRHLVIIGRSELVAFPEFFVDTVPAKTDTGAYRSAIHAADIVEKNGKVSFFLLKDHINSPYSREVKNKSFKKVVVENSFGVEEERYSVNLKVKVANKVFYSEFTLADRSMKKYPILLGRTLTNKRFLVDSSKSYIDKKALSKVSIKLDDDLEVTEK